MPEHHITSRIATIINVDFKEEVDNALVKARLGKQTKSDINLVIHYIHIHEKRLQSSKKGIYQLWDQTFQQTPVIDTRLIIGNRYSRNMTRELVHRRPQL